MPKIYFDFIKKFTKLATNFHIGWIRLISKNVLLYINIYKYETLKGI